MNGDLFKMLVKGTVAAVILYGIMKMADVTQSESAAAKARAGADIPKMSEAQITEQKISQAKNELEAIFQSMTHYINGQDSNIVNLQSKSNVDLFQTIKLPWNGTANASGEILDPWNNPYQFVFAQNEALNQKGYGVRSRGPNGIDDADPGDDLLSWKWVTVQTVYR